MIEIGRVIREVRRKKGLKQKDLARMAEMSGSSLCDIEKGRVDPSLKSLYKIAGALDEPLYKLFKDINEAGNKKERNDDNA